MAREVWLKAQALCSSSLMQEKLPFTHCRNASFPKRLAPDFPPPAERQPNRLLPASPSRDAGIAAKMALCPRSHTENGCRCKAGLGDTQRRGGERPSLPSRSRSADARRGWRRLAACRRCRWIPHPLCVASFFPYKDDL